MLVLLRMLLTQSTNGFILLKRTSVRGSSMYAVYKAQVVCICLECSQYNVQAGFYTLFRMLPIQGTRGLICLECCQYRIQKGYSI